MAYPPNPTGSNIWYLSLLVDILKILQDELIHQIKVYIKGKYRIPDEERVNICNLRNIENGVLSNKELLPNEVGMINAIHLSYTVPQEFKNIKKIRARVSQYEKTQQAPISLLSRLSDVLSQLKCLPLKFTPADLRAYTQARKLWSTLDQTIFERCVGSPLPNNEKDTFEEQGSTQTSSALSQNLEMNTVPTLQQKLTRASRRKQEIQWDSSTIIVKKSVANEPQKIKKQFRKNYSKKQ